MDDDGDDHDDADDRDYGNDDSVDQFDGERACEKGPTEFDDVHHGSH